MRSLTFQPSRIWLFYLMLAMAGVWVMARLYQLTVSEFDARTAEARENVLTRVNEPAPRGVIYDRNGTLLARNLPSFVVTITPASLPDDPDPTDDVYPPQTQAIFRRLAELLDMPLTVPGSTPQQPCRTPAGRGIRDLVDEFKDFTPYNAVKIKCDVDARTAFIVQQEIGTLPMPGVNVVVEPVRDYPTGALTASLIGYMARIPSPQDAPFTYEAAIARNLLPDRDRIGVAGVEASLDELLAGQNGSRLIEEDAAGRTIRVSGVETETVAGRNVELTIDVRLQAAVEAALLRRLRQVFDYTGGGQNFTSGVVIVMNPNTGEVLSMVSWPTYDNNRFARNLDFEYYTQFAGDPDARPPIEPNPDYPLLNHAVSILYPPGSVFKVVTASGAMEDGVISPDRELEDPGKITVKNTYLSAAAADPNATREFVCWIYRTTNGGHGQVNFTRGIADSCNVYFYKIGGGYEPEKVDGLGIGRLDRLESGGGGLVKWMQLFGFGERTGVELPAEQAGFIPDPNWKRINQGESWSLGDTYNAVIGQGFVQVTPLQMLNAYNVIANGGQLIRPRIVARVLDGEGNVLETRGAEVIRTLPLSPETIRLVQEGLRQTVTDGTLSGVRTYGDTTPIVNLPGINAAGKTGSAEYCDRQAWLEDLCIPGRWPAHAWTFMYAPYENPEVSVIAFVYNGGEGSIIAGPVANDALRAYFQIFKGVNFDELPATEEPEATPTP
ncbi:MAG: penicillin-binding transpeptidase domain-containing protein [Anaerolineales bacterium]